MGKRGPKGKSPELDAKQGFPSRRKAKAKAAIAAETPPEPIQHHCKDSSFVPHPPIWLKKGGRVHWANIFSDPSNRLHYKMSDHFIIARYCDMLDRIDTMKVRQPRATIRVVTTVTIKVPSKGGGTKTAKQEVWKPNPQYRALRELELDAERTAALIFHTPQSRMAHSAKLMQGDGNKPPAPPASPSAPKGPLGALKRPTVHAPSPTTSPSLPPAGTKPN